MGIFNGFVLAWYIIMNKKLKTEIHYFFSLVLLALSLKIASTILYTFDVNSNRLMLQVGCLSSLLIGPSLYFYTRKLMNLDAKNWKIHYIPIFILTILSFLFFPYDSYVHFWNEYLILVIYIHWFIYIIFTGLEVLSAFKKLKSVFNLNTKIWSVVFYLGNLLIFGAQAFIFFTADHYIIGGVFYTILFYLLLCLIAFQKKDRWNILYGKSVKYFGKSIVSKKGNDDLKKIQDLMINDKLYKNSKLKLKDLSKETGLPSHYLSQLINEKCGKSFSLFVNEFRVEEAIKMIKSNTSFSLEGIGYESGFNSKSNFYYYFKKLKGTSPNKFINRNS